MSIPAAGERPSVRAREKPLMRMKTSGHYERGPLVNPCRLGSTARSGTGPIAETPKRGVQCHFRMWRFARRQKGLISLPLQMVRVASSLTILNPAGTGLRCSSPDGVCGLKIGERLTSQPHGVPNSGSAPSRTPSANCCPDRLSVPTRTPPAESPPVQPASCGACLPFVSRAACVCARCRRRSTSRARSCASPRWSPAR